MTDVFDVANSSVDTADDNSHMQTGSIISNDQFLFIMFIILGVICQTVAVFGTINNVINCVIFVKQGFSDTVNISLLALAISDLGSLLCIIGSNLCFTPAVRNSDIPFVPDEVHVLTGGWPHIAFTRVTGLITAFISLERCVCVILPLKVKSIFTPMRNVIIMVSFFVITMGCSSFIYINVGLDWRFIPERNRTLIGIVYYMDTYRRTITYAVSYAINGVFTPMSFFISLVVFTVILVVKLNRNAAWRYSNSSAKGQANENSITASTKEMKVAKMVVLISIMFIICFIPTVGSFIAGFVEPRLNTEGLYRNLFLVIMALSFTAEAINSSINIFVYFRMSTRYRDSFLSMFNLKRFVNLK